MANCTKCGMELGAIRCIRSQYRPCERDHLEDLRVEQIERAERLMDRGGVVALEQAEVLMQDAAFLRDEIEYVDARAWREVA